MSSIENWISIIGSIASIGGGFWAFIEARKAKKSAFKAEKIKGEIIDRRKLVEVSQIHTETKRILTKVSAVGPSCTSSLVRGINCSGIAQEVEEYCRFLNEQSNHFTTSFGNQAKELCESLKKDIELLAEAKKFEEKKNAGKSIYYQINAFMPVVKSVADDNKEKISIT